MLIPPEEITKARKILGDYASDMTDDDIVEYLCQLKKMATFVLDIIEEDEEMVREIYRKK